MLQYATLVTAGPTSTATTFDQFASKVVSFSSQYGPYGWSANRTLGRPDVLSYGDASQAWSPWYQNGTSEQLTVGFGTQVYASAVSIRENFGNGFVTAVDVRNAATGAYQTVWAGTDPSKSGTVTVFQVSFAKTAYLVDAVRIHVDTNHSWTYEDIDAVELSGQQVPPVPNAAPTVATAAHASASVVTGKTVGLSVLGADDGGEASLKYAWTATTLPTGATAPTFSAVGTNAAKNVTATFSKAGIYVLTATITDAGGLKVTSSVTVTVNSTLTAVSVTPSATTVTVGGTKQFTARTVDQFGVAMATQPTFIWKTTLGTISSTGLLTAPATTGTATVSATAGTLGGSTTIQVTSLLGLKTSSLTSLVQSLFGDGSLSRQDTIKLLLSVGGDGTVDSGELADLKTIVTYGVSTYHMATYVQTLAADVVNGNTANAHYQGKTLGNLQAGSTSTQLTELVDKWFLGTDHPDAGSYSYATANGALYVGAVSYSDMHQGALGDCYFLTALGTLATSTPSVITNMIVDNGDSTFTVRFYAGGKADYVTVDRMLPVNSSGKLAFDGSGSYASSTTTELWLPLLEKAYAQWNETGKEGRDGTNSYSGIEAGWMTDVYTQAIGTTTTSLWSLDSSTKSAVINALNAKQAVTIGTDSYGGYGLYGSHAYAVIAYNAASDTFTLYNPWGTDHPGPLSWSQLQATCTGVAIANAAGTKAATTLLTVGQQNTVGADSQSATPAARWTALLDAVYSSHTE